MKMEAAPKEDEFAIAVHEAGHLLVGLVFGRKIKMVTLDPVEKQRGCFWETPPDEKWNDFEEVAGLLAGPRAQVELCPASIPEERLHLFRERIIRPMTEPRRIPAEIYDHMGWQHDITPIYRRLCLPDAPAAGMPRAISHSKVVEMAEHHVLVFFGKDLARATALQIAEYLHSKRVLESADAVAAVERTQLLESAHRERWLQWE
jgi:hypothetical protein